MSVEQSHANTPENKEATAQRVEEIIESHGSLAEYVKKRIQEQRDSEGANDIHTVTEEQAGTEAGGVDALAEEDGPESLQEGLSVVFETLSEAISNQREIVKDLEQMIAGLREGEEVDLGVLETQLNESVNRHYSDSEDKFENSEDKELFFMLNRAVTEGKNRESVELETNKSMRTLLEMAWEIKEQSTEADQARTGDIINEYSDKWHLSNSEHYSLKSLVDMKEDEFDKVEIQLLESANDMARLESVNAVIANKEPDLIHTKAEVAELDEAAEAEEMEKWDAEAELQRQLAEAAKVTAEADKKEAAAWSKVEDELRGIYPELTGIDLDRDDLNFVLDEANNARRKASLVLQRLMGVDFADIPELTARYNSENLDNSSWIVGFLLRKNVKYNVSSSKSEKFKEEYTEHMDRYISQQAWSRRSDLLPGLLKIEKQARENDDPDGIAEDLATAIELLSKKYLGKNQKRELGSKLGKVYEHKFAGPASVNELQGTSEHSGEVTDLDSRRSRLKKFGARIVSVTKDLAA